MFPKITIQNALQRFKLPSVQHIQTRQMKVAVVGACGTIGAPTMMLLKMNPNVTKLVGIDKDPSVINVVKDLSQLNFPAKVSGFVSNEGIESALWGSHLVIQTANSVPFTPDTSEEDLLDGNAEIIKNLAETASCICPNACFLIVTHPINSMVPLFCKTMEQQGTLNANKVFGLCNLSGIRASSYIAEWKGLDPRSVKCPVIGGGSPNTTVPVLSMATPKVNFTNESLTILAENIQGYKITDPSSQPTAMAIAYAAATLADSILKGLKGKLQIGDCAFVKSNICGTGYFASPLILGKVGIERNLGLPKLNSFEEKLLETCITNLHEEVKKGESYVQKSTLRF